MQVAEEISGREMLQRELEKRCRQNPHYSLRAFAKSLGLGHSILSMVMSGKRDLSEKSAERVASHLGLNPAQHRALVRASNLHNRREIKINRDFNTSDEQYERISLETFAVISEWHYYAILSLLELPDSRDDYKWIAARLGIGETQAKIAVERLSRLKLIAKDKNGKLRQSGKPLKIDNSHSTAATRSFYKGLLKKATQSIDEFAIEDRDLSSMTVAIKASQLAYVRKRIKNFRRELALEIEAKGSPDSVFELMIQFFPLTKPKENI